MNIVIVGMGVAGVTAAEAARKLDPKAYITIFNAEKDLFYYRIRLPEIVSGALSLEKIIAHSKEWFQERQLEVRSGERAVAIDAKEKTVRGSMGSRLRYDKLLIATGAESNRPPFPGANLEGVFAVRSLKDAWELANYARGKKHAVLIGGGILGLEMAYALTKLGLTVTVLERSERILPRQTTAQSAAKLEKMLSAIGMECKVGVEVKSIGGNNKVSEVFLNTGESLEAQVVLISAGINPTLNLGQEMGLKIDRGILVDKFLTTSEPDIYAAGDCAQAENCIGGLWTISQRQGQIAGENMVLPQAERKEFVPDPPSNILKVAGIDLVAAGNIDAENQFTAAVAQTENSYRKVVVEQGRLAGYTNLGVTRGNRELAKALTGRKEISAELLKELENPDFDFSKF